MKFSTLITLLVLWTTMAGRAQQIPVEMEIQFLASETIAEVNIDQSEVIGYVKTFNESLQAALARTTTRADVYVVQTIHKDQPVSVEIYARPAMGSGELQKIKEQLLAIKAPNTKLVDFPLLFKAKVNGGLEGSQAAFTPEFQIPAEKQLAEFQRKNLQAQYEAIKSWARTEAIPVLAAFETRVDDKFEGVRAVGSLLTTTDFRKKQDVKALTEHSNSYWRACLEMSRGNQLIPASKAFMYAAQGELDKANLYLNLLQPISDPKSVPFILGQELNDMLRAFQQQVYEEVQKGIAFHDKGNFAAAVAAYDQLLAIYPASAWVNYERYHSQNALSQTKGKVLNEELWNKSKAVVYNCNPLYPMDVHASTGQEAYLLFKRKGLAELFQAREKLKSDYVDYADAALQLGEYGVAAQMDWIIFSTFPEGEQGPGNRLAYFLYCLDKLGNKEIIKNFKGDFKKEFALIDARLDKDMKQSAIYKSFKN
jgi:hypothetical protein